MSKRVLWIGAALSLAACTSASDDTAVERRRPRPDARQPDAAPTPPPSTGGTVSCYRSGNPSATCSAPQVCCFTNYSSQHDGSCSSGACTWGTIRCDGPEDCAAGEHCCAHATVDPDEGTQGYMLACQASACGSPPLDHELCHPGGTCPSGLSCVSAYGNANDLPRSLYVCR